MDTIKTVLDIFSISRKLSYEITFLIPLCISSFILFIINIYMNLFNKMISDILFITTIVLLIFVIYYFINQIFNDKKVMYSWIKALKKLNTKDKKYLKEHFYSNNELNMVCFVENNDRNENLYNLMFLGFIKEYEFINIDYEITTIIYINCDLYYFYIFNNRCRNNINNIFGKIDTIKG